MSNVELQAKYSDFISLECKQVSWHALVTLVQYTTKRSGLSRFYRFLSINFLMITNIQFLVSVAFSFILNLIYIFTPCVQKMA